MRGKDLIAATLFGGGSSGGGGGTGGGGNIDEKDGATYLYITLGEGRTSPMMSVKLNGTLTIDWGDGTEPEVLTGTSLSSNTNSSHHEYATAGDYVIRMVVDGQMDLYGYDGENTGAKVLCYSTQVDSRNCAYNNAIRKVVIGENVGIVASTFQNCNALASVVLHNDAGFGQVKTFMGCSSLKTFEIPDGVTSIGDRTFHNCFSLSVVKIPGSVTSVKTYAFYGCRSAKVIDFTALTSVPPSDHSYNFREIPADCEIRVPAALYDEWIAATNWATYADYIKAY